MYIDASYSLAPPPRVALFLMRGPTKTRSPTLTNFASLASVVPGDWIAASTKRNFYQALHKLHVFASSQRRR